VKETLRDERLSSVLFSISALDLKVTMNAKKSPPVSNLNAGLAGGVAVLVIATLLVFFGDHENPLQQTRDRLSRLEESILSYVKEHGEAPSSLEELDLPEEDLQDHLGEPFMYTRQEGTVSITSYGSDKKPGGHFFKRDHEVVVELFPSQP
jgi:hypothetical protein